ncbi:MAG TPA: hypothetical protein VHO69_15775 [Phototrophicaceae bacterium]|nr:hypothetical protein [Phototrophicaceae bacterium]
MNDDQLDYTAIRRRVEIELQQGRRRSQVILFAVNCFLFALFMIIAWGILPNEVGFSITEDAVDVMVMMAVGWLLALVMHGLTVFVVGSPGWMEKYRKRLSAREIEYARLGVDDVLQENDYVKAKRAPRDKLQLSDEGELLDIVEADEADAHVRQMGR